MPQLRIPWSHQKQVIPPASQEILGLGLTFAPTPSHLLSKTKAQASAQDILRVVSLKTFWVGKEENPSKLIPKLKIKSDWFPPIACNEAYKRRLQFKLRIQKLFSSSKNIKHNLSNFHRKLLATLRFDDQLVFADADKGLGICAVELLVYIERCLKHFKNPVTYAHISKEEAGRDIYAQRSNIGLD